MPESSRPIAVSCRQLAPVVGDTAGNRARIAEGARAAAAEGAQLVVFPELAASGYSFADGAELRAEAHPRDGELIAEWAGLAAELGIVLVAGYPETGDDGNVYNSAAVVDPSGVLAHYRKVHLWDAEKLIFTPGDAAPPVVETAVGRIGLAICYDIEFPEWVRSIALAGAELLCAPVNWPLLPRPAGERPGEIVRAQANAAMNRLAIAVCDRSGDDRGQLWVGGSVVLDADGYPLTELILGAPGAVSASVDVAASRDKMISERNHVLADRRPELYTDLIRPTKEHP